MNRSQELPWESLQATWQESPPEDRLDALRLRRRVRLQGLGLFLLAGIEILLAAAALIYLTSLTLASPRPSILVGTAAVFLFLAMAFAFSFWNRRGLWRAHGESTSAFAELWHRRCLGQLRTVRFTWALLAAEVIFLAAWFPWQIRTTPTLQAAGSAPFVRAYSMLALITLAYVIFLVWFRKRTLGELAEVERWLAEDRIER